MLEIQDRRRIRIDDREPGGEARYIGIGMVEAISGRRVGTAPAIPAHSPEEPERAGSPAQAGCEAIRGRTAHVVAPVRPDEAPSKPNLPETGQRAARQHTQEETQ